MVIYVSTDHVFANYRCHQADGTSVMFHAALKIPKEIPILIRRPDTRYIL